MANISQDVIIVTSSLTKDMTGKVCLGSITCCLRMQLVCCVQYIHMHIATLHLKTTCRCEIIPTYVCTYIRMYIHTYVQFGSVGKYIRKFVSTPG